MGYEVYYEAERAKRELMVARIWLIIAIIFFVVGYLLFKGNANLFSKVVFTISFGDLLFAFINWIQ